MIEIGRNMFKIMIQVLFLDGQLIGYFMKYFQNEVKNKVYNLEYL